MVAAIPIIKFPESVSVIDRVWRARRRDFGMADSDLPHAAGSNTMHKRNILISFGAAVKVGILRIGQQVDWFGGKNKWEARWESDSETRGQGRRRRRRQRDVNSYHCQLVDCQYL